MDVGRLRIQTHLSHAVDDVDRAGERRVKTSGSLDNARFQRTLLRAYGAELGESIFWTANSDSCLTQKHFRADICEKNRFATRPDFISI